MKKTIIKNLLDSRGFSLAEMAVTLVILSIIIGVVSVSGMRGVKDSKTNSYVEELRTVKAAVTQFYKDNGQWPNAQMTGASTGPNDATPSTIDAKLGTYYDGSLNTRWAVYCDGTGADGLRLVAHHMGADQRAQLLTAMAGVCQATGNIGAAAGDYNYNISCTVIPAAEITVAAQCN